MSRLRHNLFGIKLMVIVVIVTQPLYCSTKDLTYNGRSPNSLRHQLQRLLEPLALYSDHLNGNCPTILLTQLNKNAMKKSCHFYNEDEKPNNCITTEQELALARRDSARQRFLERLRNEAADQEFERVMMKNMLRERLAHAKHHQKPRVELLKRMRIPQQKETRMYSPEKDEQFRMTSFCEKAKTKYKPAENLETTTYKPPEHFETTSTVSPSTKPPKICPKHKAHQAIPNNKDLFKLTRIMKKNALLIFRNLHLLEVELCKRPSSTCQKPEPVEEIQDEPEPTPTDVTVATETQTTELQITDNSGEQLDKPKLVTTTTAPVTSTHKPHRFFHFGVRHPSERETAASKAAALKEEQRLAHKVREEQYLRRDSSLSSRNLQRLMRLQDKLKRGQYETAPPEAAHLKLIASTPTEKKYSNRMDYAQGKQQLFQLQHPSANAKYSPKKHHKNYNTLQILNSKEKIKKNVEQKLKKMFAIPVKVWPVSADARQRQRQQRQHQNFKQQYNNLNIPMIASS